MKRQMLANIGILIIVALVLVDKFVVAVPLALYMTIAVASVALIMINLVRMVRQRRKSNR